VGDWAPYRSVLATRLASPRVVRGDLVLAGAWNKERRRAESARARLCSELIFVDQAAESVTAPEPIEAEHLARVLRLLRAAAAARASGAAGARCNATCRRPRRVPGGGAGLADGGVAGIRGRLRELPATSCGTSAGCAVACIANEAGCAQGVALRLKRGVAPEVYPPRSIRWRAAPDRDDEPLSYIRRHPALCEGDLSLGTESPNRPSRSL
jgi:hypothetical protein